MANNSPAITIDDNHIYRVDGVTKPGVTEILTRFGIYKYDARWFTEEAKALGIALHAGCAIINKGGELDWDSVDYRNFEELKAYEVLHSELRFKPLMVEEKLYSRRWNFCGMQDLVCETENGIMVIDLKRGMSTAQAKLQTAGYAIQVSEKLTGTQDKSLINFSDTLIKRYALQNFNGGKPSFKPFDNPQDIAVFKGLVNAYHWCTNEGLNRTGGK